MPSLLSAPVLGDEADEGDESPETEESEESEESESEESDPSEESEESEDTPEEDEEEDEDDEEFVAPDLPDTANAAAAAAHQRIADRNAERSAEGDGVIDGDGELASVQDELPISVVPEVDLALICSSYVDELSNIIMNGME